MFYKQDNNRHMKLLGRIPTRVNLWQLFFALVIGAGLVASAGPAPHPRAVNRLDFRPPI